MTTPNSYENVPLQNAQLSPNSKKLAYVEKNNIYIMDQFSEKNLKDSTQITTDGKENTIYNGITDWVYEEEILHSTNALYWSPNSQYLAFIKFDDSSVEEFTILMYNEEPYSEKKTIRYPKVDSRNPTVSIEVHDTLSGKTLQMNLADSIKQVFGDLYYIWTVQFCSDTELIVVYVNREQKKSITVVYDVATGSPKLEKEFPSAEINEANGWNTPKGLLISTANKLYFQIWSVNNYANVIAFNYNTGTVEQITSGSFDVTDILKVNENTREIYYIATNGDPMQRHIFRKKFLDPKSEVNNTS